MRIHEDRDGAKRKLAYNPCAVKGFPVICITLYKVVADYLETSLASLDANPNATDLLAYVQREFYN